MSKVYHVDWIKLTRRLPAGEDTERKAALRCGISPPSIANIKNELPISTKQVVKIENSLGCSAVQFLKDSDIGRWIADNPQSILKDKVRETERFHLEVLWQRAGTTTPFGPLSDSNCAVRTGDRIRIHVAVEPAAYLSLIWIKPDGRPAPLYPWKDREWQERVPEANRQSLTLPENRDEAWEITAPGGVETVLVVATDNRLTRMFQKELQSLFMSELAGHAVPCERDVFALEYRFRADLPPTLHRLPLSHSTVHVTDPISVRHQILLGALQPLVRAVAVCSFRTSGSSNV